MRGLLGGSAGRRPTGCRGRRPAVGRGARAPASSRTTPPRRLQPGEELPPERGEHEVGAEPDEPDEDDRREDPIVGAVLRLLVDEVGDAGADADQLGDDEVGPGPAEQHAHVGVDVGDDPRQHHLGDERAPRGPQRLRRLQQRRIDPPGRVGDDQDLLEERPDEDDGDLGRVLDPQHRHRQRAERRRRQVAEEFDERLGQPRRRPAARRRGSPAARR